MTSITIVKNTIKAGHFEFMPGMSLQTAANLIKVLDWLEYDTLDRLEELGSAPYWIMTRPDGPFLPIADEESLDDFLREYLKPPRIVQGVLRSDANRALKKSTKRK